MEAIPMSDVMERFAAERAERTDDVGRACRDVLRLLAEVERLSAERDRLAEGLVMWRRHCEEAEAERDRLRDGIAALVEDYTAPPHWRSSEQMAVPVDRLKALLDD